MVDRGRQRDYYGYSFIHGMIITIVCNQYNFKIKIITIIFL